MKRKNKFYKLKFFAGELVALGIVLVFIAVTLVFSSTKNDSSFPHRNIVDLKISQYSDKNINQSAISINFDFKDLAFNKSAKPISPFSNQIATVIRSVKSITKSALPEEKRERGSWVWTPVLDMTPDYIKSILTQAKENEINALYVSIDSYLDIFNMPKGSERDNKKKNFGDTLEYFIAEANKKGIEVDAEAGWRNWAEDDNAYKAFAVVNFVKNFNAERKNKFRGFQYDVEPYLLDYYEENKTAVLKNFVKLIDETELFLESDPLKFSVVIPDFYDEKDKMTPKFYYNGEKTYAFKHLLNILDRRPGGSIILMSYRNFAVGKDGSIEISSNEMQTAKRGAYATKIIIAQEVSDVPPPYITFHNTSKERLLNQLAEINIAYNSHSNFGGIAIHYINALLTLK